jgi:DNA-binding NarL/FixJ family response regulator
VIRLMLVDDQPLFREGVRAVLSNDPELVVVGEANDGQEALVVCERTRPDVVLMDLQMPGMNGVVATRRLGVQSPGVKVLVLTTFEDDEHVFEALRAGAVGYLLKDVSGARLNEAVRAAARGESFLTPVVATRVISELHRLQQRAPEPAAKSPFSEREQQVLTLLLKGASNKEISAALFISEGTVKNHLTAIYATLEVTDRTQAALKARSLGY